MISRLAALLRVYQERVPQWLRVAIVLVWAGLIWFGSSQSPSEGPRPPGWSYFTNSGHVFVFGALAALVLLSSRGCTVSMAVLSVVLTVVWGVVDELHQSTVDGRHMDPWDVGSDTAGAAAAVCLVLWLRTRDRRAGILVVPLLLVGAATVHMAAR